MGDPASYAQRRAGKNAIRSAGQVARQTLLYPASGKLYRLPIEGSYSSAGSSEAVSAAVASSAAVSSAGAACSVTSTSSVSSVTTAEP